MSDAYHVPVLADEVISLLEPASGDTFVDATLGGGGHAALIAERLQPNGRLIVFDQDQEALDAARDRLNSYSLTIIPIHSNFRNIDSMLAQHGIDQVDGIIADLGLSSHQLDAVDRGFTFRSDAPLDMRMNQSERETAAGLLDRLDEREIARILWELGDERWAARIAKMIVAERARKPLTTTKQLADLVSAAIPKAAQPRNIHPATRTFMALRMALQDELGALDEFLVKGVSHLRPGGRIAVISYHSKEDTRVKHAFVMMTGRCTCPSDFPECRCGAHRDLDIITRKPVIPTDEEIRRNPRARSAKLRAARKTGG